MQVMKIKNFWWFLFGFMGLSIASVAGGQAPDRAELIEGGLVISSPRAGQLVSAGTSITVTVEAEGSFEATRVMLL
ncbi:MAG: hypothetical protein CVV18_02615, partial [Gammaproteobacteria bacterium HGW-Gammaproteobacteria-8]